MIYIFSVLLLIINLFNFQYSMNSFIFLALHLVLYFFIFICGKNRNIIFKFIQMLIISWPFSWINILGTSTKELQLPWFYIFGLIIFFLLLFKRFNKKSFQGDRSLILSFVFLIFYSVFPLVNAHNILNGFADFLMIVFFLFIMFAAYVSDFCFSDFELSELRKLFIFVNLSCAVGMIFQYVMFTFFGQVFFILDRTGSFNGGVQTACNLMLEDTSCSTIMLGCGVLYSFIIADKEKKKSFYILAVIILIGLALTSRRTSVLSLLIILVPYFFFEKRGVFNKLITLIVLPIIMVGTLYFLSLSRPVNNVSQYLNDTGRFADYMSGIDVALKNPFGIGYGDTYLSSLMNKKIIPHNTMLRLLDMGGVLLLFPVVFIFGKILFLSKRSNLIYEFWNLLYVYLASNFIPDILNSRFLILIFLFVLLNKNVKKEVKNYE